MKITDEQLNRFGMLIDSIMSARTYTSWGALPPDICLEAIESILGDVSGNARELYIEIAGDDPWKDHPKEIQP